MPGVDALRVFLVVLGAPIHMYIYDNKPNRLFAWWTVHESSSVFYLLWAIHLFRMPAFMLLAGYFCAWMLKSKSLKEFVKNRIGRVLVPFIFFYVIVLPWFDGTISYRYVYGNDRTLYIFNSQYVLDSYERLLHGRLFVYHLWFLAALLIYYVLVCGGVLFYRHKWVQSKLLFLNSKAQDHAGFSALTLVGALTFSSVATVSGSRHWSMIPMAPLLFRTRSGSHIFSPFLLRDFCCSFRQKLLLFSSKTSRRSF